MKFLLIESDEAVRLGAVEILAMKGFDADAASCGKLDSPIRSGFKYDAVITAENLNMPCNIPVIKLKKPYTADELINSIKKYIKGIE